MGAVSHSFLEKSKKFHDDDEYDYGDYFNIMFFCFVFTMAFAWHNWMNAADSVVVLF